MKHLVVFTGAGMSAESGLKTFRDSDGLWEGYNVHDVATPEGWKANPKLVLDFYNDRRKQALEASPNEGHKIIKQLEGKFKVSIITQNVDDLHERAGSTDVLHLHGQLQKSRSTYDESLVYDIEGWKLNLGDLCEKGHQLRPHIVWFGEMVPIMDDAIRITSQADLLLIVGTSMAVYPAASLIHFIKPKIPIYLVDPNPPQIQLQNLTVIKETGTVGLTLFMSLFT